MKIGPLSIRSNFIFRCLPFNVAVILLLSIAFLNASAFTAEEAVTVSQPEHTANEINIEEEEGYIQEIFSELLPTLESALEHKDLHETLPKRTYIYGKDQRSNQREIDRLLDKAIDSLNLSGLERNRADIRELQAKVKESRLAAARYKELRLTAPKNNSLGTFGKINPLKKTKEYYDNLIADEEENADDYQNRIENIKAEFAKKLRRIGLTITDEGIDSLLFSVVGDQFVKLVNVFDNLKKVTFQLQRLTEESGETIEIAERYYGMYVVLNETLDRIQKSFIRSVHEDHIPILKTYIKDAEDNIGEARRLIGEGGHNETALRSNIESNGLTVTAAQSYIAYLKSQADMIARENEVLEKNLETARNTYKTVKVSGNVAMLIQHGRQRFDTLMRLDMPELRGFENQVMQREFQRITEEMTVYQ